MDEVAITLPHLRYGYRETPLTWKDLHQFIVVEKDVEKMARSVSQQQDYERFKLQLRRKWRSMMDYVLCDKFDIESMVDPETSLRYAVDRKDLQTSPSAAVAVDNDYDSVKQARLKLTRNDFPYYLDEGIEHWILWKLGGSPISEQEILNAKTKLAARSTEEINMDFLHWINPLMCSRFPVSITCTFCAARTRHVVVSVVQMKMLHKTYQKDVSVYDYYYSSMSSFATQRKVVQPDSPIVAQSQ